MILVLALIFLSASQALTPKHLRILRSKKYYDARQVADKFAGLQHAGWCSIFFCEGSMTKREAFMAVTKQGLEICYMWKNPDGNCEELMSYLLEGLNNFESGDRNNNGLLTKTECETYFNNRCYNHGQNCPPEAYFPKYKLKVLQSDATIGEIGSKLLAQQNENFCPFFFKDGAELGRCKTEAMVTTFVVGTLCHHLKYKNGANRQSKFECDALLRIIKTNLRKFNSVDTNKNQKLSMEECRSHYGDAENDKEEEDEESDDEDEDADDEDEDADGEDEDADGEDADDEDMDLRVVQIGNQNVQVSYILDKATDLGLIEEGYRPKTKQDVYRIIDQLNAIKRQMEMEQKMRKMRGKKGQ